MITLLDLVEGNEIQAFLRQSLPLEPARRKDGSTYRFVHRKPQKASSQGLSRFLGTVVSNDTDSRVLTLNVTGINSNMIPVPSFGSEQAEIHYSTFSSVRLYSPVHHEPRDPTHRAGIAVFPAVGTTGFYRSYRTLTAVHIPQDFTPPQTITSFVTYLGNNLELGGIPIVFNP